MLILHPSTSTSYQDIVAEICGLDWAGLSARDMLAAAWAYYYFSVQFRENLQLAGELYPEDGKLAALRREECATANLSPFPGVALPGEAMDHDEFMRRLLALAPMEEDRLARFDAAGQAYLAEMREAEPIARALSISSYEDGGLEAVFTAMLRAPAHDEPALAAFRFFLAEHIRFDSDAGGGHGSLSRHLAPDESVLEIWIAFRNLLLDCVPALRPGEA